jgi:hypothetical protein
MRRKSKFPIWIIGIGIIVIGFVGFDYFYKGINGDPDKINETAQILKGNMEEKYGIVITDSEGFYTNVVGYGATLTTVTGITFDAWNRQNGPVDFYMEEFWLKKGLDKWGYADKYISDVENINLNVGYRNEAKKDINKLNQNIEDVKDELWLTLYIDLREPFQEKKAEKVEQGIYNYYQQLQKDGAKGVELIVRHADDTGSYMILRDENGRLPNINNVESISETIFK